MITTFKNIPIELEQNNIIEADMDDTTIEMILFNIGQRYNTKGQLRILVNKINNKSSFNNSQVQLIKKYGGKYDTRNEVWFITL